MKLEHIALQVPEPAAIADWYVEHLGCRIVRKGGEPSHARFVSDTQGAVMMELYRNPKVPVPDYASLDPLLLHLAFVTEQPKADTERLVKAGSKVVEALFTSPSGDQIVMLRDPWGLALQLVKRAEPMLSNDWE